MKLPAIWIITDRKRVGSLPETLVRALSAVPRGAIGMQLREKDLDGGALLKLAKELRTITREYEAPLAINARFDIALACEADGVHLGGDAPRIDVIKPIVGDLRIGVSIHHSELPPPAADYAFLAPIFHKAGVAPLGLDALRSCCAQTTVPIYALGGVTAQNARSCIQAGARGVAVVGAVLSSADPGEAASKLFDACRSGD